MKAVVIANTGAPEVLTVTEIDQAVPVVAEFLVRVVAAGVNPIDAKTRAGGGVSAHLNYPATLGLDFSGVVVSSPYEGHPIQPGDEVFGMVPVPRQQGTYAEYVVVPSTAIARKPSSLSHSEAAAIPVAALTAWAMVVELAKAHDGQRMLIHAGAGGVGHLAVQLAHFFGARVTTTGSTRNLEWLRELGAHEVIDYTTTRFEEVVHDQDVVIDLIGNVHDNTGTRSLATLRPGGLIVNAPTGSWPNFMQDATAAGMRATHVKVAADGTILSSIAQLFDSGNLRVHVDKEFPLDQAAAAHHAIESGHTRGKIVLTVAQD